MSEHALAVARFFIEKAAQDQQPITPMKLIKMAYIAHGWMLGFTGTPLIGEPIEAWKYGPVVRSIYRYFRDYGGNPIASEEAINLPSLKEQAQVQELLESVWNVYSRFDGLQLSTMTHKPQTPWYRAWYEEGGSRRSSALISDDRIAEYYRKLIHERQPT